MGRRMLKTSKSIFDLCCELILWFLNHIRTLKYLFYSLRWTWIRPLKSRQIINALQCSWQNFWAILLFWPLFLFLSWNKSKSLSRLLNLINRNRKTYIYGRLFFLKATFVFKPNFCGLVLSTFWIKLDPPTLKRFQVRQAKLIAYHF